MVIIKTRAFVHTFSDVWKYSDRRLCFILGNGASKTSGIRTPGDLAELWLRDIEDRMQDEPSAYSDFLKFNNIDPDNPAATYTEIYNERFRYDPALGIEYINREVASASPAYGYAVLAQILAEKHHNIVITTGFDNLVEEALYTYTAKRPYICDQESMAAFAKPSVKQPLILRIADDKQKVNGNNGWVNALTNILGSCIPVILGCDGADNTRLLDYLEQIPRFENMFWCRQKGNTLSTRVTTLIEKHRGKLVDIDGFDELMLLLQDSLNLPALTEGIKTFAESRSSQYQENIEKIRARQSSSLPGPAMPLKGEEQRARSSATSPEQAVVAHPVQEVAPAAEPVIEQKTYQPGANALPSPSEGKTGDHWTAWEHQARTAKTANEKAAIYIQALQALPDSSELHINFAILLQDSLRDYDRAEQHYKRALALSPDNPNYNGNYAAFLYDIRKDHDLAEQFYKKALSLDPNNANTNANYGLFLKKVRRDYDVAEKYYKVALSIDPHNATYEVNYALFLKDVRKHYDEAENYFRKAIEIDPANANAYGNYALFLKDVRKDYNAAEQCYRKAVDLKPDNAGYIGNYAGFLHYIRKDYETAVKYYRKALEIDPNNAINTGNYANLLKHISKAGDISENIFRTSLEFGPMSGNYKGSHAQVLKNISRDYAGAEKHYKKALELDPSNATNNSNYAGFLKNVTKDYDQAEKYYRKALQLDPDNADYNCNFAIFLKDIRQDYYGAQTHYKKSLEIEPDNANNNGNYAGFLFAIGRDKQAWSYLDTALRNCTDDTLLAELHFYQYAHVPAEREKSLQLLKLLLTKGIRSIGFNLQPNVEGAKQDGHPDPEKLQLIADILTKDAPITNL